MQENLSNNMETTHRVEDDNMEEEQQDQVIRAFDNNMAIIISAYIILPYISSRAMVTTVIMTKSQTKSCTTFVVLT
jgi:hypothetical protein